MAELKLAVGNGGENAATSTMSRVLKCRRAAARPETAVDQSPAAAANQAGAALRGQAHLVYQVLGRRKRRRPNANRIPPHFY